MKLNATTALHSPQILLVPYSAHHVPQYHTWMQSPQLQKLTASEPLSLEEEYAMQQSWRNDGDKLTFIACSPVTKSLEGRDVVVGGSDDADERMIGDVNLFLSEDDGDGDEAVEGQEVKKVIGELEIMIASQEARGKGLGNAILLSFLWYIINNLSPILQEFTKTKASFKFLRVKIDAGNERSIRLFEKIGFTKASSTPNYFGEVELRLSPSEAASLVREMQEPSIALYRLPAAKEA